MSQAKVGTWLVRTLSQKMLGPITKEQVSQWILSGRISLQDEICQANGYWFFVHEKEEVKQWLGIELPPAKFERTRDAFGTDEVTETEPGTPRTRGSKTGAHTPLSPITSDGQYAAHAPESTQMLVRPPSGNTPPMGTLNSGHSGHAQPAQDAAEESSSTPNRFFTQVGWLFIAGLAGLVAVIVRLTRLD